MERLTYPIEPSADIWMDTLDLVRYVTTGNMEATSEILGQYDGRPEDTQQLYAGLLMVAGQLVNRTAASEEVSREAVLDDLRRLFPGAGVT
jgi:hypothetical protein